MRQMLLCYFMGTWIGVTGGVAINLTFLESEGRKKHTLNYNKVHMPSPQQLQLGIKLMVCQLFHSFLKTTKNPTII